MVIIIKQRDRTGLIDQMDLIGDVNDCDCIIVDDIIDTVGTLYKAAEVLEGSFASHGLFTGPGLDRIASSQLEEVVILNTIPTSP